MRLFENQNNLPASYNSCRVVEDIKHAFILGKLLDGKIEESTVVLLDILDDIKAIESYINGFYRTPRTIREFTINIARRLNELGLLEHLVNVEIDMAKREAVFYIDGKTDKMFQFRDVAKSIGYPVEILKLEKYDNDPFKMFVLKFKFEGLGDEEDKDEQEVGAEPPERVPEPEEENKFYFTCPNDGTEFEIEIKPSGEAPEMPVSPEGPPPEEPKESIQLECKLCGYTDVIEVPNVPENYINKVRQVVPVCYESAAFIVNDLLKTKDYLFVMRKYALLPEHMQKIVDGLKVLNEDTRLQCGICSGLVVQKEHKFECQNCSFTEDVPIEPGDTFKDIPMDSEKFAKELMGKMVGKKPPYTVADLKTISKLENKCIYCESSLMATNVAWCTKCGYVITEQGHPPIIEICDEGKIYDPMIGKCVDAEAFKKAGALD